MLFFLHKKWELGGSSKDAAALDVFNTAVNKDSVNVTDSEVDNTLTKSSTVVSVRLLSYFLLQLHLRGSSIGELKDLEEEEEEVNTSKAKKRSIIWLSI